MRTSFHEQQAEQFLDYYRRQVGPWHEAFAFWADSKDFWPSDRLAIRSIVVAELLADGTLSSVDINELPEEAA